MAQGAMKPCAHAGCGLLVTVGQRHCAQHAHQHRQSKGRSIFTPMYQEPEYRRQRAAFLLAHPLCGCGSRATVLDHVVPHRGDRRLFMDQANWSAVCKRCHDRKTGRLDGGFGNEVK